MASRAARPFSIRRWRGLAFRLPDELKVRKGLGKWLLRRWVGEHVPEAQPMAKKRGFTVPVGEWIARRGAELGPLVAAQPGIGEICVPGAVEKLFLEAERQARRLRLPGRCCSTRCGTATISSAGPPPATRSRRWRRAADCR